MSYKDKKFTGNLAIRLTWREKFKLPVNILFIQVNNID